MPMPTDQDVWPHCHVVKGSFWAAVGEQNLEVVAPWRQQEGDGINPRSMLRMRLEKAEAAWSGIFFQSKRRAFNV